MLCYHIVSLWTGSMFRARSKGKLDDNITKPAKQLLHIDTLTSNVTNGCSASLMKNSMLIVMIPLLKKRAFRKMVLFWEKTLKWPSDVVVSKINLICGKYSKRPFSNSFSTSFIPDSSLIRLGSIDKSNKTVCADIIHSFNCPRQLNLNTHTHKKHRSLLIFTPKIIQMTELFCLRQLSQYPADEHWLSCMYKRTNLPAKKKSSDL